MANNNFIDAVVVILYEGRLPSSPSPFSPCQISQNEGEIWFIEYKIIRMIVAFFPSYFVVSLADSKKSRHDGVLWLQNKPWSKIWMKFGE